GCPAPRFAGVRSPGHGRAKPGHLSASFDGCSDRSARPSSGPDPEPELMSPTPLRVLHCSSGNLYGGVETLLVTLAQQAAPGVRPEFALCFEGRASAELRAVGADVHWLAPVRFSRPWTVWRARRALRRLLAARPFDVVVCHGPWTHWV